jgi:hypothetical protein
MTLIATEGRTGATKVIHAANAHGTRSYYVTSESFRRMPPLATKRGCICKVQFTQKSSAAVRTSGRVSVPVVSQPVPYV